MTDGINNLFKQVSTDQVQETQVAEDEVTYIGEGKKYSTIQDADKAFGHLNKHVLTLEEENAKLRAATEKARTVDEILEAIANKERFQEEDAPLPTSKGYPQELDINAIVEQAVNKISLKEHEKQEVSNAKEVVAKLTSKYGDKAGEMYAKKAEELGIDLDAISKQSPKAVLAFFEEGSKPSGATAVGTVNTASLTNDQHQYGTYEYWNKLEKEGKISREKKFQKQHESLMKLGAEKFYQK
jgi:hypothetical protein